MERFASDLIAAVVMLIFAVIGGYSIAYFLEPNIGEEQAAGALAFVFILPLLLVGAFIGKYVAKKLLSINSTSHKDA